MAHWSLGGNVIPQAEAKGNVAEIKCPKVAGQREKERYRTVGGLHVGFIVADRWG